MYVVQLDLLPPSGGKMNNTYPILPSRPIHPHITTTCTNKRCNMPLEFPVPNPSPRQGTLLQIRCFSCQNILSHAYYSGQEQSSAGAYGSTSRPAASTPSAGQPSSSAAGGQQARKGRKIGTQERPLETGYYDLLGIPVTATTEDVKKAYRACSFSPQCLLADSSFHYRTGGHQAPSR